MWTIRNKDFSTYALILLGIAAPIIPQLWDGDLLTIIASISCMLIWMRIGMRGLRIWTPFLAIVFASCAARISISTDFKLLWKSASASCLDSCFDFLPILRDIYVPVFRALGSAGHWLIFSFFLAAFLYSAHYRERFSRAIAIGALIAGPIMLLQFFGLLDTNFVSQDHFWRSIDRFGGIASDPNALGVLAYLIIGISVVSYARSQSKMYPALICIWGFLGAVAGSRTFVAGSLAAFFVYCWITRRKVFWVALSLTLVALSVLCCGISAPSSLPLSLQRVVSSFTEEGGFSSRIIFWKTGSYISMEHPLFGIGLGQFQRYFPEAAKMLGYQLNGWNDNANSFYLAVAVELGLIGLFALIVSLKRFSWKRSEPGACAFVAGFLVQLLFGPHLDFIEVAVIAPALVSHALESLEWNRSSSNPRWIAFGFVALLFNLFLFSREQWGVVRRGPDTFSIMRRGQVTAYCDLPQVFLQLKAPFTPKEPYTVFIRSSNGLSRSLSVEDSDTMTIEIPCGKKTQLYFECSRFWLPRLIGPAVDSRPQCLTIRMLGAHYG